jgi:rubrerythrin
MKIHEVSSKSALTKSLDKIRKSHVGIRMLNIHELEYVLDRYGEDNMRVYICPECGHKNIDHWAEEPCSACDAPSQFS